MARIVITVTDTPDGGVAFESEPKMAVLLERKKKHGVESLSRGEVYAVIALNHMLQNASRDLQEGKKGKIILPPGIMS